MQISDKLYEYNRNVTNGTEELQSARGVQKLVSTAGELETGSIFEGTVNQVKNGRVTLALGNGQTITARLDGKVDIKPGASMFFQVKSNDGMTVAIRPYMGAGNTGNPILLNALTAAQIPVTERNLSMVDFMMQEQMPIGRQSILDMVKILNANPQVDANTVVRMVKLGLPVTEELATQFENYQTNRHMILNEMNQAVGELATLLGDEGLSAETAFSLYDKTLQIMLGNGENPAQGNRAAMTGEAVEGSGETEQKGAPEFLGTSEFSEVPGLSGTTEHFGASELSENAGGTNPSVFSENWAAKEALNQILSERKLSNLAKSLQNIPTLTGNPDIFVEGESEEVYVDTMSDEKMAGNMGNMGEGMEVSTERAKIRQEMPAEDFLKALRQALTENSQYGYAGVRKLFASPEFQKVFKAVLGQQWLVKPEELKQQNKMGELYEKIELQIRQLESAVRAAVDGENSFLQTAADVRGNIEFMNQVNQIYTYVQLPLKLTGQNANGELYVYTNKKQMGEPGTELTAFLHLDMEHLGSTDVSVRLMERKVNTRFYLSDDASYGLLEKHLPILEKH